MMSNTDVTDAFLKLQGSTRPLNTSLDISSEVDDALRKMSGTQICGVQALECPASLQQNENCSEIRQHMYQRGFPLSNSAYKKPTMSRIWLSLINLLLILVIVDAKSIRARYPNQMYYGFEASDNPKHRIVLSDADRRNFLPSRRLNLWGSRTSKIIEGSAFIPQNVADYTGKLSQRRRELFKWGPDSDFANQYLRYHK
ncbi:hypothetical protein QR680_008314 [Steinernema hermaphroditum]|uniref:Uncharacterized protein n=1 Tax=Steinernema hermaphroditum TaxID=289476 RepID=A0AA39IIJ9_9BILA|nr:hypothetical protein QR680_008314 [Steinernema hermaphroditum]